MGVFLQPTGTEFKQMCNLQQNHRESKKVIEADKLTFNGHIKVIIRTFIKHALFHWMA